IAARKFTALRQYGKAVQFCAQNNDTEALNRVVGALLNEYLVNGLYAHRLVVECLTMTPGHREFILLVDQIPTELMYPTENLPNDRQIFCIRLAFTVAYAEFHFAVSSNNKEARVGEELEELLEESGPQAPKTWWGLILVDLGDFLAREFTVSSACEQYSDPGLEDEAKISSKHMALALARLEEIFIRSKHGAGSDYLWALMRRYNMKTEAEALQRLERVRFTMIHSAATSMISEVGGTGSIMEN
ncbi:9043_t:CDS:1, partial [Acaulospora colombiana]